MLALAGSRLGDVTAYFAPRRRYIGTRIWMWQIRREGIQVTDRGDYIFISDRGSFVNASVREARLHTYHRTAGSSC